MYFLQIRGLWLKQNGQPNLGINSEKKWNLQSKTLGRIFILIVRLPRTNAILN
jgi:hypothetical protein